MNDTILFLMQVALDHQSLLLSAAGWLLGTIIVYKMIVSGDWVRVLVGIGILIFVVHILSGCTPSNDLGGFTERAQLRADAEVQKAYVEKDRAIGVAKQQKEGVIESAKANADAEVATNRAWAGALPTALIILCFTIVLIAMIYWKGKLDLVQATNYGKVQLLNRKILLQSGPQYRNLGDRPPTPLTQAQIRALDYYAQKHSLQVRIINGEHYLTDGKVTYKALLKNPDK